MTARGAIGIAKWGGAGKSGTITVNNAFESIHYFRDPNLEGAQIAPSKILCLGKVQSGKTSFFLASVALAFDNGYDAAFILGGTKLKLKEQNLDRVCASFENNEKIKRSCVKIRENQNFVISSK